MENIFPDEIKKAITSLDNEARQKILSYLILHGKEGYSNLKTKVELTNGNINYHLNTLEEGGLIENMISSELKQNNQVGSYYQISEFGKQFINSLYKSLESTRIQTFIERNDLIFSWDEEIVPEISPKSTKEENYGLVTSSAQSPKLTLEEIPTISA